jgi:hypothetical protein
MKIYPTIELSFTKEHFIQLLEMMLTEQEIKYTNEQFVAWCESNVRKCRDDGQTGDIDMLLDILKDVDAQWELYLVNTYSFEQLSVLDLSSVQLPKEYFQEWLDCANKLA